MMEQSERSRREILAKANFERIWYTRDPIQFPPLEKFDIYLYSIIK
jgi:hypothetical protein